MSRARAALRAHRPIEASDEVARARELAGETLPPIRAVSDEVEAVIRAAATAWEALVAALAEGRHMEAIRQAETLARTAADVPGPGGRLVAEVLSVSLERKADADALVARAQAAPPEGRAALLVQALRIVTDHQQARTALEAVGVQPPPSVNVRRDGGTVEISWHASPSAGEIRYRVRRVAADGSARAVGVTSALNLSDGGAPVSGPLPDYEVSAGCWGVWSTPARWSASTPAFPARAASSSSSPSSSPSSSSPSGASAAPSPAGSPASPAGSPAPTPTAADAVPPATGLRADGGVLRWVWPAGCTEMIVVWREDAPASGADDPQGHARKVTNTRYEIDGGVRLPPGRPLHVAVFACLRDNGRLVVASAASPSARMLLPET